MARYVLLNTDKIIGRQMTADVSVTITQILEEFREESKNREQGLLAQIGNLSNSHEELVQGLRRELETKLTRLK